MKKIKRILVFLLTLTLFWTPVATVVYAQEQGKPVAAAVDTEESAAEMENADESDDRTESPEQSDTDTENRSESADEPDDGAENPEQSDADSENTGGSADGGENEEQDSGDDGFDEDQPDGDDEQDAEESGENPDDIDTELETIGEEKPPEETADEDIVYTEEELYDWCSDHRNSGGQVTLGGNITITETISISNGSGHIVIDTGQYCLVYDGGCIVLMGDLEIIGEGVDVPVLDIQTVIHYGYYWESSWNDVVRELNITATGRNGTGGIAVRVRQDDGYSARYSNYRDEGLIRSYGTGAIGIYLDEPGDVHCFQIEVEGDGSAAVYAPQGVNLYYCKLTAEGDGASVVSGFGEIVVDTCAASPEPQDVQVVNYRIAGVSGSRLYYPVRQYGSFGIGNLNSNITFLLSAGGSYPSVTQAFLIDWQLDTIDTGVLGQITIQGNVELPFQGLGLEDDFPLKFTVDVRDPDIPCISSIQFKEDLELGAYIYLTFWDTYERGGENVILWRSDDGGVTWYTITDSSDIEWFGNRMFYYYGAISDTVMLQLEVLDKGKSNVVSMYSVDGKVCGDHGGDRDGGDRNTITVSNNGNTADVGNSTADGYSSDDGGRSENGDSTDGSSSTGDNALENDHSNDSGAASGNGNESNSGSSSGNENTSGSGNKTNNENGSVLIAVFTGIIEAAAAEIETTTTPKEWEDGDTIAIFGRRLAAMIEANPKAVTFIKNGIQISISPADLLALGLGENQLFLVEIKKLTGSSFSVLFRADNMELSGLPFAAYIGETMFDGISPASAVCIDENGNVLPSEYDPGTGKLSVSMTGSGVFALQAGQFSEAASLLVQDNVGVQEQGRLPDEAPAPLDVGIEASAPLHADIEASAPLHADIEAPAPLGVGMIVVGISAIFLPAGSFVWRKRRLVRR